MADTISKGEYLQFAQDTHKAFQEALSRSDWTVTQKTDDFIVSKAHEKGKPTLWKIETTFDYPPEIVKRGFGDLQRRTQWDDGAAASDLIKDVAPDMIIARFASKSAAGGLISPREFYDLISIVHDGDRITSAAANMDQFSKLYPTTKGFTRGINYPTGWVWEPLNISQES
eukprot:TRINITY_DN3944_c0_g1_i3.p1 TRINITY_DN3944_c0_g1~~TRINITY_DN3944_c0_g1_i3.p1  ORF type:complete len:180 (-),score=25.36 TRINITY_DN3944_c0_g1_i3:169-681(-)